MEKWTVTAVNGNLKAKSGNNHPLFIAVSIEDANGAPGNRSRSATSFSQPRWREDSPSVKP